jgi:hypothetical protein
MAGIGSFRTCLSGTSGLWRECESPATVFMGLLSLLNYLKSNLNLFINFIIKFEVKCY